MAEGVTKIEKRPFAGLPFVGGNHLGLVGAGAMDRLDQRLAVAAGNLSMLASSQTRKGRSRIRPYLMTSARPALSSRSGKVSRVAMSASTSGLIEGADHVLCPGDG